MTFCKRVCKILVNLDHRGATGADCEAGRRLWRARPDPSWVFAPECAKLGLSLPAAGHFGIGQFFMPRDRSARAPGRKDRRRSWLRTKARFSSAGATFPSTIPILAKGEGGRTSAPPIVHRPRTGVLDEDDFERKLFVLRKVVSNRIYAAGSPSFAEYYPVSMSCRTVVYKGMVLAPQLGGLLRRFARPSLRNRAGACPSAFRHQYVPVLAPCPSLSHGPPTTARSIRCAGNVNWMAARQASVSSKLFGQ